METPDIISTPKWWRTKPAIIFFVSGIILLAGGGVLAFEKKYQNKIYPGVHVGNLNLGGLNMDEAQTKIEMETDKIINNGATFYYQNHTANIPLKIKSLSPDDSYSLFDYDLSATAANSYNHGRDQNWSKNIIKKIKCRINSCQLPAVMIINEPGLAKYLEESFGKYDLPAANASLLYKKDKNGSSFVVLAEKYGKKIDYATGLKNLENNLIFLKNEVVKLTDHSDYPEVTKQNEAALTALAGEKIAVAPLMLQFEEEKWTINEVALAGWLELVKKNRETTVDFSLEKISQWLKENLATSINRAPAIQKFTITDGRVTDFQISTDGRELDVEQSAGLIKTALDNKQSTTTIVVNKIINQEKAEDIKYGIKEIIGTGKSNFSGSPKNRRHNIRTGANKVHGTLIAPNEEFSLLKTLGEIDASTGYLPELVIKEGKTLPEYGGGLCQIGTTVFRGATESGLPITQRKNHSYRVPYYEPAGTDATIYDPAPDFRFINDTGNYILIQSRIGANDLYFDFWGTKDGRKITKTKPIIYNIVKPPATKIIETTDLKPGEKKCTEKAHNGADAYFDYKVEYNDGKIKEKRFSSHYVPWQEVCLLGVTQISTSTPETTGDGIASSTPTDIATSTP